MPFLPITVTVLVLYCLSFSGVLRGDESVSHILACPSEHQIMVTFESGSSWQLCWDSRLRENIVLSHVYYQPSPAVAPIPVINSIRLSQLHVAYDDSPVTYSDVTQYGLGERNISQINPSDCPAGEVLSIDGVPGLCKRVTSQHDVTPSASGLETTDSLILYSTSQVGSYAYLVTWQFFADGSIKPSVGAAGALQRSSDKHNTKHGRKLGNNPDKVWLSHTHNYYWRIDFDLGEQANDDRVIEWQTVAGTDGRQANQYQRLTAESALKLAPDTMLSWFITDGETNTTVDAANVSAARGFLIEPINNGHRFVRESIEPYSAYDFFVTTQKDCERFATDNSKYHPGCTDSVLDFTNGETLVDADIVVWHRVSFHHVPRNEDLDSMHSHWDGFMLRSRNFGYHAGASAPFAAAFSQSDHTTTNGHDHVSDHGVPDETVTSLAAALPSPPLSDQQNRVGDVVSITMASTPDGQTNRYTAEGLPEGLTLSTDGKLTGTPTKAGDFDVSVRFSSSDNVTTTYAFQWTIEDTPDASALGCRIIDKHRDGSAMSYDDLFAGGIEWWVLLIALYARRRIRGVQSVTSNHRDETPA